MQTDTNTEKIAKELLKFFDAINRELVSASKLGNFSQVRELLEIGADVEYKNQACLRYAIFTGNLEIVREIVEAGADVNAIMDDDYTPLMLSAYCGKLDVAQYLLKNGANPEIVTKYSALFLAVKHDRPKFIPLLLENGAKMETKVNGKGFNGYLHLCQGQGVLLRYSSRKNVTAT